MKTSVHLISMPWQVFVLPSASIGGLKAYVDRAFEGQVPTRTYSAHAGIFLEAFGDAAPEFSHLAWVELGEIIYFFAYYLRFFPKKKQKLALSKLISIFNERHKPPRKITLKLIREIESATRRYIDEEIIPELSSDGCNVVGFTVNFHQLYSSIFCQRYLRERCPEQRFVFLYGGWAGGSPMALEMLKMHECDGFGVIGEGERKLEETLRVVLETEEGEFEELRKRIPSSVRGLYHVSDPVDLYRRDEANYRSQFSSMESLPLPDYDEYFKLLEDRLSKSAYSWLKDRLFITMEGTRGCFAHCDFCSMNAQWEGFRKMSPDQVVSRARALCDRHGINRVLFLDNVCDTWAEDYADALLASGARIISEMELRAHHPERFWTKLALSGVLQIQVGVEAISSALLRKIDKGTLVVQNICAQKYLAELGIIPGANLITHHPKSTSEDILETQRILELIPHFPPFDLAHFTLDVGSPIFFSIPGESREVKRQLLYSIHRSVDSYLAGHGYEFPQRYPVGPASKWDRFVKWYREFRENHLMKASSLTVTRFPSGRIQIVDRRLGEHKEYSFEGVEARIYDLCHKGLKLSVIAREAEVDEAKARSILDGFVANGLILELDGFFVSLALRPRDELVANLMNGAQSTSLRLLSIKGTPAT